MVSGFRSGKSRPSPANSTCARAARTSAVPKASSTEAQSGVRYPRVTSSETAAAARAEYSAASRPASTASASLSFSGGANEIRGTPSALTRDVSPAKTSNTATAARAAASERSLCSSRSIALPCGSSSRVLLARARMTTSHACVAPKHSPSADRTPMAIDPSAERDRRMFSAVTSASDMEVILDADSARLDSSARILTSLTPCVLLSVTDTAPESQRSSHVATAKSALPPVCE
mmetsp:Transcript_14128/g.59768  ORF Transcript_14128/g.59768 Transcript_14128/m.59768 type:complete len:233 (-) Transcript_14128:2231-2929(-)